MFVTLKLVMKRLSEIIDVISAAPLKTRFTKCFDKQAEVEVNVRELTVDQSVRRKNKKTEFSSQSSSLTFLFSSTWQNSSSMSDRYLSCRRNSQQPQTNSPLDSADASNDHCFNLFSCFMQNCCYWHNLIYTLSFPALIQTLNLKIKTECVFDFLTGTD